MQDQNATGTVIRVVMDVEIANGPTFERIARESGEVNGLDEGEMLKSPLYEILANRLDMTTGAAIVDFASFVKTDDMPAVTPLVATRLGILPANFIGKE